MVNNLFKFIPLPNAEELELFAIFTSSDNSSNSNNEHESNDHIENDVDEH